MKNISIFELKQMLAEAQLQEEINSQLIGAAERANIIDEINSDFTDILNQILERQHEIFSYISAYDKNDHGLEAEEPDHISQQKYGSDYLFSSSDYKDLESLGPIQTMLEWQRDLSNALGVDGNSPNAIPHIIQCLISEATEVNNHFLNSTKPWKPIEVMYENVDEEMIDVLHFVLTYFNLRKFSDFDIMRAYKKKNDKNFQRLNDVNI